MLHFLMLVIILSSVNTGDGVKPDVTSNTSFKLRILDSIDAVSLHPLALGCNESQPCVTQELKTASFMIHESGLKRYPMHS